MDRPVPKIHNVIDAETQFGIQYFTRFHSYYFYPRGFVFFARFRNDPEHYHLVFCPLHIDASSLCQGVRQGLQSCLDSVISDVPDKAWNVFQVDYDRRRLIVLPPPQTEHQHTEVG